MSPYLFNLYAEYIMRNARLDEAQAGINITARNINNLRYPYGITLMTSPLWQKTKRKKRYKIIKLSNLERDSSRFQE